MTPNDSAPTVVLIVDDEAVGRMALQSLFTGPSYELLFARNGHEALALATLHSPDVVLLDVMMPDLNGFEVCQRIRADPLIAEVPIVLVTALDDRDSRLAGLSAGADDFLSKPFDRAEVRARVGTIARLNRYRKLQTAGQAVLDSYELTLEGWVKALDLRDKETEGHAHRVTTATVRLVERLGTTGEALTHVRRGALLHDIGKIAIPDAILHKPGPLSPGEWIIMRKHPIYAFEMVGDIPFLRPATTIPYCHHEKFDGTGYPQGLRGEEVPYEARAFAVVDVWDALLHDRPYRRALPRDEVVGMLKDLSGTHFDPGMAEAFLDMERAGAFDDLGPELDGEAMGPS